MELAESNSLIVTGSSVDNCTANPSYPAMDVTNAEEHSLRSDSFRSEFLRVVSVVYQVLILQIFQMLPQF